MNQETFKNSVFVLKDKLYRFANRILADQDDAYDLVQEVMLKLWEQKHTLKELKNVEAYAMQITKNMAYNKLEKLVPRNNYLKQLPNDIQQEKYPSLTQELILTLIDKLPEKQRLVMYLRDIEEYEIDDIATLTGSTEPAVRTNLSRARAVVKMQLTKVFDYEKRRIG